MTIGLRSAQAQDLGALPEVRGDGPGLRIVGSLGVRADCSLVAGKPETQGGAGHRTKPHISTRGGLGSRRIWACVSTKQVPFADVLRISVDRIGYGNTPAEAFAEWEAS